MSDRALRALLEQVFEELDIAISCRIEPSQAQLRRWRDELSQALAAQLQEQEKDARVGQTKVNRLTLATAAENQTKDATVTPTQGSNVLEHLDCLMSDRLREWVRNIDEPGGHDITQWGDKRFVARAMRDIADGIDRAIKTASSSSSPALPASPARPTEAFPIYQGQEWQCRYVFPDSRCCGLSLNHAGDHFPILVAAFPARPEERVTIMRNGIVGEIVHACGRDLPCAACEINDLKETIRILYPLQAKLAALTAASPARARLIKDAQHKIAHAKVVVERLKDSPAFDLLDEAEDSLDALLVQISEEGRQAPPEIVGSRGDRVPYVRESLTPTRDLVHPASTRPCGCDPAAAHVSEDCARAGRCRCES
jgi:hypothetical protein